MPEKRVDQELMGRTCLLQMRRGHDIGIGGSHRSSGDLGVGIGGGTVLFIDVQQHNHYNFQDQYNAADLVAFHISDQNGF